MKLSGKFASLHITEQSVRVVEAVVDRGMVEIQNAFMIKNVDRFFSRGKLVNLGAMVETITMSMSANGMTAKRLFVSFDNMFTTAFSIDPPSSYSNRKKIELFKKKGNRDEFDPDSNGGATVKHQHSWGQYITQDDQGEAVTIVLGESDLITSFVAEFKTHGYKVMSIEPPDTAMIYSRQSVDFSYDSMNKIIIRADNDDIGDLYVMTKDVPSMIKRIQFDSLESTNMMDRIREICLREVTAGQMRNPYVYLIGDAFADMDLYTRIAEDLECEGLQVIDIYGIAKDSVQIPGSVQIKVKENEEIHCEELTGEYGICICLLLRCFEDKPENMYESKFSASVPAKYKLLAANVLEIAVALFLFVNAGLTAATMYEWVTVMDQVDDSYSLQTQLAKAENERDTARLQLQALGTIDTRLNDVFTFIYENVDSTLNIASVDTVDMIPTSKGSSSAYAEDEASASGSTPQGSTSSTGSEASADSEEAIQSATEYTQKQLVIRGYSMKSSGPIDLYNALQKAGIGDVKLVGHQQMVLPSGETIYAFELRAGEGATLG